MTIALGVGPTIPDTPMIHNCWLYHIFITFCLLSMNFLSNHHPPVKASCQNVASLKSKKFFRKPLEFQPDFLVSGDRESHHCLCHYSLFWDARDVDAKRGPNWNDEGGLAWKPGGFLQCFLVNELFFFFRGRFSRKSDHKLLGDVSFVWPAAISGPVGDGV